ncbi:hypothetical protein ACFVZW_25450 [Streptomyces sp. NPDC059567]|uniref:hypothetical protein n=1 Tax=Streptomyces sp. NPDC059567 TaxID=3346867 RepID=UPI003699D80B
MVDSVEPGEPVAPLELRQVIEAIVSAVRDGDNARVEVLLDHFARVADAGAMFTLRQRLHQDLRE